MFHTGRHLIACLTPLVGRSLQKYLHERDSAFFGMPSELRLFLLQEFWSTKDATNHNGHEDESSGRSTSVFNSQIALHAYKIPLTQIVVNTPSTVHLPLSTVHALASGNTTFPLLCSV